MNTMQVLDACAETAKQHDRIEEWKREFTWQRRDTGIAESAVKALAYVGLPDEAKAIKRQHTSK